MTREEAIKMLKSKMDGHTDTSYEWAETVRMAIEALSQELCGDCISRQAVEEIINDIRDCISVEGYWAILERMKKLSPVNPQRMGHWIAIDEEPHEDYECDNCGFIHTFIDGHTAQYNYCPNCGAKMQGGAE